MKFVLLFFCYLLINFSFAQTEGAEDSCHIIVPSTLVKNDNETLTIIIDCPISQFSFKIYNRWGNLLYETKNLTSPLDFDIHERMKRKRKKLGPEKFQTGLYYWHLEYREDGSVNTRKRNGQIYIQ